MLAKRVILCLTFDSGVLMRTKRFVADYRYTQAYSCANDADQVVLIDISPEKWPGFPDLVETYCRRLDVPLTAGGHVDSVDYALRLMNAGSFGVVVGWKYRSLYEAIAYRVGSQSLTAGLDGSDIPVRGRGGYPLGPAAAESESRGAGEILLTSIERDGSLAGYDLPTLQRVVHGASVPVLAAGGCGNWGHMRDGFAAGAAGCVTGNIFHMSEIAMRACKAYLAAHRGNWEIRPAEAV